MTRYPSVAGMFYTGNSAKLRDELRRYTSHTEKKSKVKGLIVPHAGYMYSGACAGKGFGRIRVPDRVIILGVNHRGGGHPMAVDGNDLWNTPLGDIRVDEKLRDDLLDGSEVFELDSIASRDEHSLEVQVPFIQFLNASAAILPVTIGHTGRETLKRGGEEIAELIRGSGEEILLVASTDMSHYISAEKAKGLDSLAIEKIVGLDPEGLYQTVFSNRISMCGIAPTYMMLIAVKKLGAEKAVVTEYTNSGHSSGDFEQVVGYLSAYVV